MLDVTYRRIASLEDLNGRAASFIAGGQSLLPDLKAGEAEQVDLVDIKPILPHGVSIEENLLILGAGSTHAELAQDQTLQKAAPCLADLAEHVGDPSVRNRGTIGGALVADHPAGDWPPVALALDAEFITSQRRVSFVDWRKSGNKPGEVILSIALKIPENAGYVKLLHPAQRYAIVGVFSAEVDGEERSAVTGLYEAGARLWTGASEVLPRRSDGFARADYRSALAAELQVRAYAIREGGGPFALAIVHGQPIR